MDQFDLFPADTFVVVNKTILNSKNSEILSMLYQPIIGAVAVSLYQTFCSSLDLQQIMSFEYTHHSLMLTMRLSLDQVLQARKNLEAVGLLKSYLKKGSINHYIYEIYSPLDPFDFFNHPILNSALLSSLESREYKRVWNYFKLPSFDMKEYQAVSCSFHDVFDFCDQVYETEPFFGKRNQSSFIEASSSMDFDSILSLIPDEMLNKRSITDSTLTLLKRMAFLYNFSEKEMEEIIRSSINDKHVIDTEVLKNNSCNFYKFEHKGKLPSVLYKNQPESLRKQEKTTTMKDKVIYTYEETSPYVFLQNKYGGGKPSQNDLEILSYLADEVGLNTGVINVLIDYVLRVNDNKLVYKFVSMVASQWKMSNIETVEEAMEISKRERKLRKSIKSPKKEKQVEEKPKWFDEEVKAKEDDQVSLEMEALLSQFK